MNKKILALGIVILSAQPFLAYSIIKHFNLNKNIESTKQGLFPDLVSSDDKVDGYKTTAENKDTPDLKAGSLAQNADGTDKDELVSGEMTYDLLLGEVALSRQQYDIAYKEFIEAARVLKDPAIAKRATEIAISHFDLTLADEPAKIWATNAPKDASAQITTAAIMIRLGKGDSALPYLVAVDDISPKESDRYFLSLYNELPLAEEQELVTKLLLQVQKGSPKNPGTYLALAEIYLDKSQAESGMTQIQAALEIVPEEPKAILLYAELLHQKGDDSAALAVLKSKLEASNNSSLRLYYVEFLLENKQIEEAKAQMTNFKEDKKITSATLMDLARICMKNQWYDDAKTFLIKIQEKTADNNGDVDIARYFLGRIHEVQHKYPEAISWFSKVEEGKFHISSYIRAAWLYSQNKETDKAISVLEQAHPSTLEDVKNLYLAKADLYVYKENYDTAINIIGQALQQIPEDIDLLYSRSLLAQHLNKIDMAEEDLKAILKIQPKNVDALNSLGFLLADKTKRLDESLLYINTALELSPNNPSVMDSMGWLQFRMGNHEQAVKWLQDAYAKSPDSTIAAHLSEVLWSGGQKDAASILLNKALEKKPGDITLKEVLLKIQQKP